MVWWVVDNANAVIVVLGLLTLALAAVWWNTRKRNVGIAALVALALVLTVWVLSLVIVTDRKKLTADVRTLVDEVNADQLDRAFQHFENKAEVDVAGRKVRIDKEHLKDLIGMARVELNRVGARPFNVANLEIEKVERPHAVVTFKLFPQDGGLGTCRAEYILVGENDWRIKALKVEIGMGTGQ
jgi:hypothetical protein